MTPRQRALARHALGLPNSLHRSYRNRFVAALGTPDYTEWRAIIDAGHGWRRPWAVRYGDMFWLTQAAATAVLDGRETLDLEDFA